MLCRKQGYTHVVGLQQLSEEPVQRLIVAIAQVAASIKLLFLPHQQLPRVVAAIATGSKGDLGGSSTHIQGTNQSLQDEWREGGRAIETQTINNSIM